jgi:hypothetical protein
MVFLNLPLDLDPDGFLIEIRGDFLAVELNKKKEFELIRNERINDS